MRIRTGVWLAAGMLVTAVLLLIQPAAAAAAESRFPAVVRLAATGFRSWASLSCARSLEGLEGVALLPGTVQVPPEVEEAVRRALGDGAAALPASAAYFAVTDLQAGGEWLLVSVAGLADGGQGADWRLEDAVWIGLVLLRQEGEGYAGAVEGTAAYSRLLDQVPEGVLDGADRESLDPARRPAAATASYRFPWPAGTTMAYGGLGVHRGGFIDGWKAVDFASDGNTGAGHAPNRLLAAASGSISYVCRDSASVAIRIGDLLYVHLLDNANLRTGRTFAQGDELGQLRPGPFNDRCGWSSQSNQWFHLHWAFPNTPTFTAGGWTLTLADGLWRRDGATRGIYHWFKAEEPANCPQKGGVLLYWNIHYACDNSKGHPGYLQRTSPGFQNVPLAFNDQASSLRMPAGWSVRLYQHAGRDGAWVCRSGDDADFRSVWFSGSSLALNDQVSSFHVYDNDHCGCEASRPLELYEHADYDGGALPVAEAMEVASLAGTGFDDQVSSLCLQPGWSVRLFEEEGFGGASACLTTSAFNFLHHGFGDGSPLNDRASSFILYAQPACPPLPPSPAPPPRVYPPDGAVLPGHADLNFDWDASPGATAYRVHLWGGPGVDLWSGWTPETKWHAGPQPPGSYQWQVKAQNRYENGAWSDPPWSLAVAPPQPWPLAYASHAVDDGALAPSQGDGDGLLECGETVALSLAVRNQGTVAASGVTVQVQGADPTITWLGDTLRACPGLIPPGADADSGAFVFALDPGTPDGHVLHLGLALSADGGGPWPDALDLAVSCSENSRPRAPRKPSPEDGAAGVGVAVALAWKGGDPDTGDAVAYDVWLRAGDGGPWMLVCDDAPQETCVTGRLGYGQRYAWYVVATDSRGATRQGETWVFRTGAAAHRVWLPAVAR